MKSKKPKRSAKVGKKPPTKKLHSGLRLLAGGNPQVAKADGTAPVHEYIEAMPGWKREIGHRLDALIVRTVPTVSKAVRWNSPFYGIADQGWFLSFHCLAKYIKVAFFNGTLLRPTPPVESKNEGTRYFHIYEGDVFDPILLASWIRQAAELPPLGKWATSTTWVP